MAISMLHKAWVNGKSIWMALAAVGLASGCNQLTAVDPSRAPASIQLASSKDLSAEQLLEVCGHADSYQCVFRNSEMDDGTEQKGYACVNQELGSDAQNFTGFGDSMDLALLSAHQQCLALSKPADSTASQASNPAPPEA